MADNEELEVTESPELADEQEATDAEVVFVEPREVIEKGECEPCPSMISTKRSLTWRLISIKR